MATWGNSNIKTGGWTTKDSPKGMGGLFNPGYNGSLSKIDVYLDTLAENYVRFALYENTSNDVSGATLLEDFGQKTFAGAETGWYTITSTVNPTLTNGRYLFFIGKTSYATTRFFVDFGGAQGDISSTWENVSCGGNSQADAFSDPCGAAQYSDTSATGSIVLTYTEVSTTPAGQIVVICPHDIEI